MIQNLFFFCRNSWKRSIVWILGRANLAPSYRKKISCEGFYYCWIKRYAKIVRSDVARNAVWLLILFERVVDDESKIMSSNRSTRAPTAGSFWHAAPSHWMWCTYVVAWRSLCLEIFWFFCNMTLFQKLHTQQTIYTIAQNSQVWLAVGGRMIVCGHSWLVSVNTISIVGVCFNFAHD